MNQGFSTSGISFCLPRTQTSFSLNTSEGQKGRNCVCFIPRPSSIPTKTHRFLLITTLCISGRQLGADAAYRPVFDHPCFSPTRSSPCISTLFPVLQVMFPNAAVNKKNYFTSPGHLLMHLLFAIFFHTPYFLGVTDTDMNQYMSICPREYLHMQI